MRWRRWPQLALDVQAERKLAIGRWDGLLVQIKNVGFGVARHVSVKVEESDFDGRRDTQAFSGILPERTEQIRLNVRPRSAGSSVPLAIRLSYLRPDGEEITRTINATVPVHDRDSQHMTAEKEIGQRTRIQLHQDEAFAGSAGTYQPIIIHGDYYAVDRVNASAVSIGRESAVTSGATAPPEPRARDAQVEGPSLDALAARIAAHFAAAELKGLAQALDLSVEIDAGGDPKQQALALARFTYRQGQIWRLLEQLYVERPDAADWYAEFERSGGKHSG